MANTTESLPDEDAAHPGASPLEDIEHDLNTVDEALAALDSGDLEGAEALAAELDSRRAGPSDGGDRGGGDEEPTTGSA